MSRLMRTRGRCAAALISVALLAACGDPEHSPTPTPTPSPTASPTPDPHPIEVGAAGDIACGDGTFAADQCRQMATSDLLLALNPRLVLALGDTVNGSATYAEFMKHYEPSWGRLKQITSPILGNHEYDDVDARGYFDYFNGVGEANGPAGERGRGYYSFNIGQWHFVALNSNCAQIDCAAETNWLRADLAQNTLPCTIAMMHHPLYTAPPIGGDTNVRPFWQALYDHGAEIVLSGHSHNYQRFAPQTPNGYVDRDRGVREFVVGTGGFSLYKFTAGTSNLQTSSDAVYGILHLSLDVSSYRWDFRPVASQIFAGEAWKAAPAYTDSGQQSCH